MTLYDWLLLVAIVVAFALTWIAVGFKADHDQYAATCGRYNDTRNTVEELEKAHRSYPRDPHEHPLDAEMYLYLTGPKTCSENDPKYLQIAEAADLNLYRNPLLQASTRKIKLRDLLNRLLEDVPAEFIEPVTADFKFKDAPPPPPPFVIQMPSPLYSIDNRESPLDPRPVGMAPELGMGFGPFMVFKPGAPVGGVAVGDTTRGVVGAPTDLRSFNL